MDRILADHRRALGAFEIVDFPNAEELAKQLHQSMGRDKDLPRKQPK